jgi:hypothetical protein
MVLTIKNPQTASTHSACKMGKLPQTVHLRPKLHAEWGNKSSDTTSSPKSIVLQNGDQEPNVHSRWYVPILHFKMGSFVPQCNCTSRALQRLIALMVCQTKRKNEALLIQAVARTS